MMYEYLQEEKYTWRIHWGQTKRSHGSDLALQDELEKLRKYHNLVEGLPV